MAIAFVNSARGGSVLGGQTAYTIAAMNVTAGNLIVVGIRSAYNRHTSVTDTAGNTYYAVPNPAGNAKLWYAKNVKGHASNVITVHFSPADDYVECIAAQYSGIDTVDPLDANANGVVTGSTTITSGAFTTKYKDELIICALDVEGSGTTWTAGAGYTLRENNPDYTIIFQEKIVSTIQTGVTASASNNAAAAVYKFIHVATFTNPIPRPGSSPMFFGGGVAIG